MRLSVIPNHEIDRNKYDACIGNSLQGTVYALSWYLDVVAPGWKLLATDDYRFVMPLPYKKKYGITYSMQPPLCQQLGFFSQEPVDSQILNLFLKKIPVTYYDLQLNAGNALEFSDTLFQLNYCLDLNNTYEEIRTNYTNNCRRNLKKSIREELIACETTDSATYIEVLAANSINRPIHKLIPLLKNLMEAARENAQLKIWHVRDMHGIIYSASLFLYWKNKVYYLVPFSTPEGKQKQSMSFLIDFFIQSHSSLPLVLDFEGSNIPDIARFYEGFGAVPETYPRFTKKGLASIIYAFARKLR